MIESKIYNSLMKSSIASALALYNERPAIFYQIAPTDAAEGWNNLLQYPRIDYGVDWTANAERKTSGSLLVNIWCLNESEIAPEDLANDLINELSETFYTDETGTYCVVWNTSNSYESAGDKEPKRVGVSVIFDVLAFPKQTTYTVPDPVEGLNRFIKTIYNDCYLIGFDELPETFKATNANPAVYVRFVSNKADMRRVFAVTWFDCSLSVHVIAPDPNLRLERLQNIIHTAAMLAECLLADNSPLFFKQLAVNNSVNPLHDGQLTISGRYRVQTIDPQESAPALNNINFKYPKKVVAWNE